jgi:hypothetical protein
MFNNDLSYLYSDECLTPSNFNEKEFSEKVSKYSFDRSNPIRVYQRINPILTLHHRSKHILFFRGDVHQRKRNQLIARRLKEKRQLFKNILRKKIQQFKTERLYLENNLRQNEIYKRDNNSSCLNTLAKLLLMEKEKIIPFSDDLEFSNISTTNISDSNDDN